MRFCLDCSHHVTSLHSFYSTEYTEHTHTHRSYCLPGRMKYARRNIINYIFAISYCSRNNGYIVDDISTIALFKWSVCEIYVSNVERSLCCMSLKIPAEPREKPMTKTNASNLNRAQRKYKWSRYRKNQPKIEKLFQRIHTKKKSKNGINWTNGNLRETKLDKFLINDNFSNSSAHCAVQ